MQIRSPYEVPSVQGISEGSRNFPASLRTQLGVLKKRVLTGRVDQSSQALPITKEDLQLIEGLVISLEAQLRDRAALRQSLARRTNDDLITTRRSSVLTIEQAQQQIGQLAGIQARLHDVCEAVDEASRDNTTRSYQELLAQSATYLADTLYMHTYAAGGYREWHAQFTGDTLTTGLKRGAPGSLDTVLALSPCNFTRDGGYWGVRDTSEAIIPLLSLLLSNNRLAAVAKDHPLLHADTGYTADQLTKMLANARAISAAYKAKA